MVGMIFKVQHRLPCHFLSFWNKLTLLLLKTCVLGYGRPRASLACLVAPRGATCLVPSGRSRCSGCLSRCRGAFPYLGLSPPELPGGCAGHVVAGRETGSWCLALARAEAGALGSHRAVPVWGPTMGLALAGASGVGLGLRVLRWFGLCGPGDSRVRFPVPSVFQQGPPPVHCNCFLLTPTAPPLGRRTPRPSPVGGWECLFFLAGSGRLASRARFGAPHLFFLLFCLPALRAPLRAGVALFLSFCSFVLYAPIVSGFSWFPALAALGLGTLCFLPPPPPLRVLFARSRCLWLCLVSSHGCPGPCRCAVPPPPPYFLMGVPRLVFAPGLNLFGCLFVFPVPLFPLLFLPPLFFLAVCDILPPFPA